LRKINITKFVVDETQIKVGSELIWLWIEIDTQTKNIIATRAYQKSKTWL